MVWHTDFRLELPHKRQWAGPTMSAQPSCYPFGEGGIFPKGLSGRKLLPLFQLAVGGVAHAAIGVAEQALDAATQRSDRHNGDDGDEADQQGVLHHGGTTLCPRALKQVGVKATNCEKRIQKQLSHLNIPLSHPKELRTVARLPV